MRKPVLHSEILNLVAPRLSACHAIVRAIGAQFSARPETTERLLLKMASRLGSAVQAHLDSTESESAALRATSFFDEKVDLYIVSALLQMHRTSGNSDPDDVTREMLAHQLVGTLDNAHDFAHRSFGSRVALRNLLMGVGMALNQSAARNKEPHPQTLVGLHVGCMRLLFAPDEERVDGDSSWVEQRLYRVLAAVEDRTSRVVATAAPA